MPTTFSIEGKQIPQADIDAWERRRLKTVFRRLDTPMPSTNDLKVLRIALAESKQAIGYEQLVKRLSIRLRVASLMARLLGYISGKRRTTCVVIAQVDGLSAERAASGFESLWVSPTHAEDRANLSACPDHYALIPHGPECLEVIETTGGTPFPTQFFVNNNDESALTTSRDSSYTHQIAGTARLKDGTVMGGIRHQFRSTANGVEFRLCVEFPASMPSYLIRQHQMHLACEFGNWFRHLG